MYYLTEEQVKRMPRLLPFSQGVLYLTGDREFEAVFNYIMLTHGVDITEDYCLNTARGFACNFMEKYKAKPVIAEFEGKIFLYPKFNN